MFYPRKKNSFSTKSYLTLVLLNCLWIFFFYLKLELLTQFSASNKWKIILFMKNGHLPNLLIQHLYNTRYVTHFLCISFDLQFAWKRIYIGLYGLSSTGVRAHRLRCWTNIKATSGQLLVFAGNACHFSILAVYHSKHETLAQRLWRWPNIKPTLVQRLMFAGIHLESWSCYHIEFRW